MLQRTTQHWDWRTYPWCPLWMVDVCRDRSENYLDYSLQLPDVSLRGSRGFSASQWGAAHYSVHTMENETIPLRWTLCFPWGSFLFFFFNPYARVLTSRFSPCLCFDQKRGSYRRIMTENICTSARANSTILRRITRRTTNFLFGGSIAYPVVTPSLLFLSSL